MRDFVIVADATVDLPKEIALRHGIQIIPMTVTFNNDDRVYSTEDEDFMSVEFYNRLTQGDIATTAQINVFQFYSEFENLIKRGYGVLYLGFSSQLSGTFQAAQEAARMVGKDFPEAQVEVIDTLAASAGQGLIAIKASELKAQGLNLENVLEEIEANLQLLSSWATVDDLVFLKRGGRIGATEAFLGGMLNVKPIIHLNPEGKLIPVKKVRGRRQALRALVDVMADYEPGYQNQEIFIAHGNCPEDAKTLATMIEETYKPKKINLTSIGPIIGSHTGPNALALFFYAKERKVQGM